MSARNEVVVRPRLRVAAIGWPAEQRVALLNQLGFVSRAGGEAILIVADRAAWEPIPRDVRVVEVPLKRALTPVDRAVAIPPRRWASAAATMNRARRSESWPRRIFLLVFALVGLRVPTRKRPPWWGRWTATQFYADTRGWAYWKAVEGRLFDIEPETLDYVLLRDVSGWPFAWHLAKRAPQLRVAASVPADVLSEFAAAYRKWLRTQPGQLGTRFRLWLRFLPVRLGRSPSVRWVLAHLPAGLRDRAKRLVTAR